MGGMTMLEINQLATKQAFADIVTIYELRELTYPKLAYGTIYNAINGGRLIATKKGNSPLTRKGVWLIYLPSARAIWNKRFVAKRLHDEGKL